MTLFPAGGGFSIDGVGSDAFNMYISNWSVQHQPSVRMNNIDIPGKVGKFPQKMEMSSRLISVDFRMYDAVRTNWFKHLTDFSAATDPRNGVHQFVMTDDLPGKWIGITPGQAGGSADVSWVQAALAYGSFTVGFECPDPHWYSLTSTAVNWSPTANGQTTVIQNHGNDSTPMKLRIAYPSGGSQPLTGITLSFSSTYYSSTFTYNGSLSTNQYIDVDFQNATILKLGASDMVSWGGDDFPYLAGTTTALPQYTPPLASPVSTTLTWHDTNGVGAVITGSFTERWL